MLNKVFFLIICISVLACTPKAETSRDQNNSKNSAEATRSKTKKKKKIITKKTKKKKKKEDKEKDLLEFVWSPLTATVAGLQPDFHMVGEDIYAVIGEQICKWDGTAWAPLTDEATGLLPAFHFVSETEIYAVVGELISMWDGTARTWTPLTDLQVGLVA